MASSSRRRRRSPRRTVRTATRWSTSSSPPGPAGEMTPRISFTSHPATRLRASCRRATFGDISSAVLAGCAITPLPIPAQRGRSLDVIGDLLEIRKLQRAGGDLTPLTASCSPSSRRRSSRRAERSPRTWRTWSVGDRAGAGHRAHRGDPASPPVAIDARARVGGGARSHDRGRDPRTVDRRPADALGSTGRRHAVSRWLRPVGRAPGLGRGILRDRTHADVCPDPVR